MFAGCWKDLHLNTPATAASASFCTINVPWEASAFGSPSHHAVPATWLIWFAQLPSLSANWHLANMHLLCGKVYWLSTSAFHYACFISA